MDRWFYFNPVMAGWKVEGGGPLTVWRIRGTFHFLVFLSNPADCQALHTAGTHCSRWPPPGVFAWVGILSNRLLNLTSGHSVTSRSTCSHFCTFVRPDSINPTVAVGCKRLL